MKTMKNSLVMAGRIVSGIATIQLMVEKEIRTVSYDMSNGNLEKALEEAGVKYKEEAVC